MNSIEWQLEQFFSREGKHARVYWDCDGRVSTPTPWISAQNEAGRHRKT